MALRTLQLTALIATLASITACAFYPTTSEQQQYANRCDMFTKQLTLTTTQLAELRCNNCDADAFAAVYIGVPAVTFVVSGSIVLAGNTLHWLEYQGTCESGFLAEQIRKHNLSLQ